MLEPKWLRIDIYNVSQKFPISLASGLERTETVEAQDIPEALLKRYMPKRTETVRARLH